MENNINISQTQSQPILKNEIKQRNSSTINFSELPRFYLVLHWIVVMVTLYVVVINLTGFLYGGIVALILHLSSFFILYLIFKKRYFGYVSLIIYSVIYNLLFGLRYAYINPQSFLESQYLLSNIVFLIEHFILVVFPLCIVIYSDIQNRKKEKVQSINKENTGIIKSNKSLFVGFVMVFVFLHFLFFTYNIFIGGFQDQTSAILSLLVVLLSWFGFWGIYKNKMWGYILVLLLAIISGYFSYVVGVLSLWGGMSIIGVYSLFINPVLLLITFIFSIKMIFKLQSENKNEVLGQN